MLCVRREVVGQVPGFMLRASVGVVDERPVLVLAGEADVTCEKQLNDLLAGQLAGGTTSLTIDLSGLRFADASSIRTLVLAARALRERDGHLVLLRPQRPVAKVLALLGVEHMFTIVTGARPAPRIRPCIKRPRG